MNWCYGRCYFFRENEYAGRKYRGGAGNGTGNVFTGRILKNAFPPGLAVLLDAYKTMVNGQVLSMLDPVEEEISGYQLVLQSNGAKLHTLFVEGDQLSFHTEKPVADK